MKLSLVDIYREMLYVTHGPYGRAAYRGGTGRRLQRLLDVYIHFGKVVKDNLLYGRRQVIGGDVRGKTWLLIGSKNNLDSLRFLEGKLDDAAFVAFNKVTQRLGGFPRLSFHRVIRYWYRLPWLYLRLLPAYGLLLRRRFDEFFPAVGLYETALHILRGQRPRALIFTNDHVPDMRAFALAARELGIPTVYIQHASVSDWFPPLRFDLSLLEGQDSLDKYRRCGPVEGRVEIIGMPKFDGYLPHRNLSVTVRRIGLCSNFLDDPDRITAVLERLRRAFPGREISYRPHPRDGRPITLPPGVSLSPSDREGIFDYLRRQDLIVAGSTSTHLEATLLNVTSIYFPFNDQFGDYYGYLRHGLIDRAENPDELVEMIRRQLNRRPAVVQRARYYNATVGTEFDGRSGELAIRYIRELIYK